MQGWIMVGRFMESKFEEPTISKWLVAGAAAGAATTLIGEQYHGGQSTLTLHCILVVCFISL